MTNTELTIPEGSGISAILSEDQSDLIALISRIEESARGQAALLSPDSKKGRDGLKSIAYKVSQTKAELDRRGKALNEDAQRQITIVNAARKTATEKLDELRDEIKAPALKWEETEKTRVDAIETRLSELSDLDRANSLTTSDELAAIIDQITGIETGDDWDEYRERAISAKAEALAKYGRDLEAAKLREHQEAELARLRAEKAERDRVEQERIAYEQAEAARIAAEKAEAERQERARIEHEQEMARALQQERDRAAREKKEAEMRHEAELKAAQLARERAAQVERDRIEAEKQAAAEARAKREADSKHREKIRTDIADALRTMSGAASPDQIAQALLDGKIPHTVVTL